MRLKNPHSVLETIRVRPDEVHELQIKNRSGGWDEVASLAKTMGLDYGNKGNFANVKERGAVSVEELFPKKIDGNDKTLWLALDCLQDPQNLGSIFRSAAFFGVSGILMTKDRSSPMSEVVYDVASGGVEHVPFSIETNLQNCFKVAKDRGAWILGTSEHAKKEMADVQLDRPWVVVVGNEEKGLRKLTLESCDEVCKLSAPGAIQSLNAGTATAVTLASLRFP